MFSLAGKAAIVTGAAGLLGREHCDALLAAGATVVAADIDKDGCESVAVELSARHSMSCSACQVDITDRASVTALLETVIRRCDQVDILVNNAAIDDVFKDAGPDPDGLEVYPLARWQRLLDVNLTGTFLCCQVIGSEMARRRGGSLINIASTYGVVTPDQTIYRKPDGTQSFYKSAAYPVTKAAVIALTRYLATYWGPKSVRVNCLSPGGVENGQPEFFIENYSAKTPMGRMARPDDFRGALIFLASDNANYVTGANIIVDGGWTLC